MEPFKQSVETPPRKGVVRYVLLGAVNAVAAILISLYSSGLTATADRKSVVLPLMLGLAAGALGGFLYHKIIGTKPGIRPKIIASVVYLALVLAVFAISMKVV